MAANRAGEITTTLSKPTTVSRVPFATVFRQETFWKLQAFGFLLLMGMSFSPRLFHLEEYLFFLLLVSAIVVALKTRHPLWIHTPLDVPLFVFAGWVLLTVPFAIDPLYSFGEWRKLVVQILVFYWTLLVLQQTQRRGMTSKVMAVVVFATAAVCLYALQDFVARGGTWQNRSIRAGAPNSDYNWLTTYMVIAIPIICAAAMSNLDLWRRISVICVGILAIIAQLLSYTRAGWLGIIVQGIFLGIWTGRRQIIIWVLVGVVFIGAVFAGLTHMGYQRDTVDPWTLVEARFGAWRLQAGEVMQHPIVGIGYGSGTFLKRFADYPETAKADGPHSTFLMIAMGSGIPAIGVFIWMMFRAVRVVVRGAKERVGREARAFLLAVAVVIVGFATRNCFDYMFAGSLAFLFWLLMATALSNLRSSNEFRA